MDRRTFIKRLCSLPLIGLLFFKFDKAIAETSTSGVLSDASSTYSRYMVNAFDDPIAGGLDNGGLTPFSRDAGMVEIDIIRGNRS